MDRFVPLHWSLLAYHVIAYLASLLEGTNDEFNVSDCIGEFHLLKILLIFALVI